MFNNICHGTLRIPSEVSIDATNFIARLLNRNPMERLGAGPGDAEELKTHPFFKSVKWEDVINKRLKPPKPQIRPITEVKMMFKTGQGMEEGEGEYKRMEKWSFVDNDFI